MNMILKSATAALVVLAPAAASAQRLSPAAIAVVDTDRILRECTACKTAQTQLQTQVQALQTRQQQLAAPLQTEAQAIQTAVTALQGKQPDAALQTRIQSLQTRQNTANQELGRQEQTIRSTQAHVVQQINQRLGPIINAQLAATGASIIVDRGAALAVAPNIDITNTVLAALNQQLPSVSVTPLPQQAQPAQPQSR
ncbi:OmpH family outer membrane protein [Sphingomonas sp. ID1715]|uniref:OmpH family outer membrane protein n=1 Tax=Sphingomonas sp. ID1715 TaxID=1656898 RepID=UPI0014892293|nr:OmpH family outer membrane protein [Sphingomonas sp. ID1715]NNM75398.1 OmpH family outer membrane protein [Sphingomonas sp. ID1715]